ncbi:MAG: toxin [Candidatus Omnitrophota bacterium]|nr:toxin [Candidatus Omnitrophota bacterium]
MKKVFDWDNEKNQKLIRERNISFEAIVSLIASGNVVSTVVGKGKYAHQKQFIVEMNRYIYVVPFVEERHRIFLKTIIPSRRLTKKYLSGGV